MTLPRLSREARRRERTRGGLVVLMSVALLSGCSPEVVGVTGVARDSDGGVVGVWQACDDEKLLGATLIQDANTPASRYVGEWARAAGAESERWSLTEVTSPRGWSRWDPARLEPSVGHTYTLVAWHELNVANAVGVDFRAEDLSTLRVGQVLVAEDNAVDDAPGVAVVSEGQFRGMACDGSDSRS